LPAGLHLAFAGALAAALAFAATPVAIRVANSLQFWDRPAAAAYKAHARPTPYLGGSAVMLAFVVVLLTSSGDQSRTFPLLGGVAVMWGLGTLDDRRHVSPYLRVGVELLLAVGLWALGLGWHLGIAGPVDLVLTCVWVVAVVNAFNLFDNMDGAAGTMGLVVSGSAAILGALHGDTWLAAVSAALCGSCLGFLPYNLASPTARIFLGDGGSMPIGFSVAAVVMIGASHAVPAWQALLVGLLLVGLPALDTTLVVISRRRRGISILTGGRDHLTHRMRRRLRTAGAVAVTLGSVQIVLAAFALVAAEGGSSLIIAGGVLYVMVAGAAIALLETQQARPVLVGAVPDRVSAGGGVRRSDRAPQIRPAWVLLVVLGLGCGASQFFSGFYQSGLWVPIGLALVAVAGAGAIARPPPLSRPAGLAIGGLAGFGFWTLISSRWSPTANTATIDGNRILVYAVVLAVALMLVRSRRRALLLVGGVGCGLLVVALWVVVRLLGSDPAGVFLGGRLNLPLGYINGEGCAMAIGMWAAVAAAERRGPAAAGLAAAAAAMFATLAVLSQSRGTALAVLGGALATLILVPGRRRRAVLLMLILSAVVVSWHWLVAIYHAGVTGTPAASTTSAAHHAGAAIVLASVAVGGVWGLCTAAARIADLGRWRDPFRRSVTVGLALVVAAALVVSTIKEHALGNQINAQYHAFVHLSEPASAGASQDTSRLLSGAGNRYEYWRVAWSTWRAHPLDGTGGGGFVPTWFAHRAILEDVAQPHSLELQALSETGLVGTGLLLVFLAGVGAGVWRLSRIARTSSLARVCAVAGAGGFSAWLVQTSTDWIHYLPGITGAALCLGAVLVAVPRLPAEGRLEVAPPVARPRGRRALSITAAAGIAALALGITGASLSRQGVSDLYRTRAAAAVSTNPAKAVSDANSALRVDGDVVDTYYLKAAALARENNAAGAVATIVQAIHKEPRTFVAWALLGDLQVRLGHLAEAGRMYAEAHALNPLDPSLKSLAADPSQGTRLPSGTD
jgi:UDP-GlcNAc:undecaprenyl-phosphate GlcNAc-1-phosphate transferase